jgi:hypothetical protein
VGENMCTEGASRSQAFQSRVYSVHRWGLPGVDTHCGKCIN